MTKINEQSKQVLDYLWNNAVNNDNYLKLNNDDAFIPLTVEIIEENQISICHYGEQNGDLMRDPEMVFWKDESGDYIPYYWRNDWVGIEDLTGQIFDNKLVVFDDKQLASQTEFADIWLSNIKCQQKLQF